MFVLHTTIAEVYERLWVVHEADLCVDAKLQLRGLFDLYRWTGAVRYPGEAPLTHVVVVEASRSGGGSSIRFISSSK